MLIRRAAIGALLVIVAGGILATMFRPRERPTERVSPAPQVNAEAVVWRMPDPPTDPQAGDVWISPKDGAEMVYVPAGEFLMGSADGDKDALPNEKPQHRVYLDSYWIDKYEATVGRYRSSCQATRRRMPPAPAGGWKDDHPVVNVTWDDAIEYAQWAGKRLPTEAEWEKAARGTDGRSYPWGNDWDVNKFVDTANSPGGTRPVGSYPSDASPYGAMDMAGNAFEWCADWYGDNYYQYSPQRNPGGPSGGIVRVGRGTSWSSEVHPRYCRLTHRGASPPVYRYEGYFLDCIGFRCARAAAS